MYFGCVARELSHKYVITQSTSKILYSSKLVSMQNRTFAIYYYLFYPTALFFNGFWENIHKFAWLGRRAQNWYICLMGTALANCQRWALNYFFSTLFLCRKLWQRKISWDFLRCSQLFVRNLCTKKSTVSLYICEMFFKNLKFIFVCS